MAATALPGMPSAGQAAGGDMLALRAEATGRRRAAGHGLGRLRFAFYGRVSTEDWQDPVTSRARQRDQAVALVAGHGRIVAEFFELGVSVHGLLRVGGRVAGVMTSAGERRARLVIGADGRNSRIARLAQAKTYHDHPPVTFGYYTYWRGCPVAGMHALLEPGRFFGVFPVGGGLALAFVQGPRAEYSRFRRDPLAPTSASCGRVPRWPACSARQSSPSRCAARLPCPPSFGRRRGPAGRWRATPGTTRTRSSPVGSPMPSATWT
jgi:hypothetical protein